MDTTPQLDDIIAAVTEATRRRDATRDAYGDRLEAVIRAALDAAHLQVVEVAGHRVARERIHADCSQWGNRVDYPRHPGRALLIDRALALGAVPDLSFFDGSNMQHQRGPAYCGDTRVRSAPVATLVEIGRALPGVLAPLFAERLASLAAETAALEAAPEPSAT